MKLEVLEVLVRVAAVEVLSAVPEVMVQMVVEEEVRPTQDPQAATMVETVVLEPKIGLRTLLAPVEVGEQRPTLVRVVMEVSTVEVEVDMVKTAITVRLSARAHRE